MKKFFQLFFTVLGVIFFILILTGVYFYVADPFKIKPFIKSISNQPTSTIEQTDNTVADKHPLLSPTQEKTLERFGIDPSTVSNQITPAMEECFYAKLGKTRINELKNGSEPTAADFFSARACVQ